MLIISIKMGAKRTVNPVCIGKFILRVHVDRDKARLVEQRFSIDFQLSISFTLSYPGLVN